MSREILAGIHKAGQQKSEKQAEIPKLCLHEKAAAQKTLASANQKDKPLACRNCNFLSLTGFKAKSPSPLLQTWGFWSECNYRISENVDISTVCWQSARGIYSKIEFYQILDNTLLHQMNNIANQKICVY